MYDRIRTYDFKNLGARFTEGEKLTLQKTEHLFTAAEDFTFHPSHSRAENTVQNLPATI
jgi:hypothetical protein